MMVSGRGFVIAVAFGLAIASAILTSGCADCREGADCSIGELCIEGVCEVAEGAAIEILTPSEVLAPTFDLRVRVRFRSAVATLRVTRPRGDGCAPFIPAELTLFGDGSRNLEQDVVVPGLGSAGDFDLAVVLKVDGIDVRQTQSFSGPAVPADIGGATFVSPAEGEIDVVKGAWQPLQAMVDGGRVTAFVTPSAGPSTPRIVVAESQSFVDAFVPLVRGPQVLWLESETSAGEVRRCGHGIFGGPRADDDGALEIALLTEATDAAWLGLSVRILEQTIQTICSSAVPLPACQFEERPFSPQQHNVEALRVHVDNAVVEVAAVPLVISGPVMGLIRLTRAGQHEGFFGPVSVFPSEGQTWFAGRVIVEGGRVVGIVGVDELYVGAPF